MKTSHTTDASGAKRWVTPSRVSAGLYGGTFAVLVFFGLAGLGSGAVGSAIFGFFLLLLAAGEVWLYVSRHHKYVGQLDAEAARRQSRER